MGFIAYKTTDKNGKALPESKWLIDSMYTDNMKGGKRREKEYAEQLQKSGCKIIWDKVK